MQTHNGRKGNLYCPEMMTVKTLIEESHDTVTFELEFQDEALRESFSFKPGNFVFVGAFGYGESALTIASGATKTGLLDVTFRKIGRVTGGLGRLNQGDSVGFRGPYGNRFPMEEFKGKNLIFIAGGIGLPAVTSVLFDCLEDRENYGDITVLYGARSTKDIIYRHHIKEWEDRSGYYWGTHTLTGIEEFSGQNLKVWFKNENHVSWLNGEPFIMSPDLVCMVERDSGEPKTNDTVAEGDRMAVIGARASEPFITQSMGLQVLGPGHFGFDYPFVPIGEIMG